MSFMNITNALVLSANTVATTSVSIPAWTTNVPTHSRALRLANRGPNDLWFKFDAAATVASGVFIAAGAAVEVAAGSEAAIHILPVSGAAVLSIAQGYVYAH